jgi:hypothetical protein
MLKYTKEEMLDPSEMLEGLKEHKIRLENLVAVS